MVEISSWHMSDGDCSVGGIIVAKGRTFLFLFDKKG